MQGSNGNTLSVTKKSTQLETKSMGDKSLAEGPDKRKSEVINAKDVP